MPKRPPWEQLALLGARPANDAEPRDAGAGLDAFLGDAKVVSTAQAPRCSSEVKREAGRRAQRVGAALERWVEQLLTSAETEHHLIEWWIKVEPKVKYQAVPEGARWRWELRWAGRAAADYTAILAGTGKPLVIECKTVNGDDFKHSELAEQQLKHLEAAARVGGVALLCVEFAVTRQYLIPWRQVPWQMARKALHLYEAPCARWRVRGGEVLERLRGR